MTIRLTLVAAGSGGTTREVRFSDDGPLSDSSLITARKLRSGLPAVDRSVAAPSVRCRQTAAALGFDPVVDHGWRDIDVGGWQGRTLDEVAEADPVGIASWMSDPNAAPHGGESVADHCRRVGELLAAIPDDAGRLLVVTEPAVVRAAVVHALATSPAAYRHIDVEPLAVVRLTAHRGRWNLRLGG